MRTTATLATALVASLSLLPSAVASDDAAGIAVPLQKRGADDESRQLTKRDDTVDWSVLEVRTFVQRFALSRPSLIALVLSHRLTSLLPRQSTRRPPTSTSAFTVTARSRPVLLRSATLPPPRRSRSTDSAARTLSAAPAASCSRIARPPPRPPRRRPSSKPPPRPRA